MLVTEPTTDLRAETCTKLKSKSLALYSHSCVDSIAGSVTDTYKLERGFANANGFIRGLNLPAKASEDPLRKCNGSYQGVNSLEFSLFILSPAGLVALPVVSWQSW
jgi:hypothetical protein